MFKTKVCTTAMLVPLISMLESTKMERYPVPWCL